MDGQTQRIQLVSADNSMALGHRIQVMPRHSSLVNKTNETGSFKTCPPQSGESGSVDICSRSGVKRRASCSSPPQHQKEGMWCSLVWGLTLCERALLTRWQESQTTLMSLNFFLCYFNTTTEVSNHIFSLTTLIFLYRKVSKWARVKHSPPKYCVYLVVNWRILCIHNYECDYSLNGGALQGRAIYSFLKMCIHYSFLQLIWNPTLQGSQQQCLKR